MSWRHISLQASLRLPLADSPPASCLTLNPSETTCFVIKGRTKNRQERRWILASNGPSLPPPPTQPVWSGRRSTERRAAPLDILPTSRDTERGEKETGAGGSNRHRLLPTETRRRRRRGACILAHRRLSYLPLPCWEAACSSKRRRRCVRLSL